MSAEFDASLTCSDPIRSEILAEHRRLVENWAKMPSALANAKLHAERELQRLFNACNRIAWGAASASGGRSPNAQEIAELLNRLRPEERERLLRDSQLAAEQRHLIGLMELAERQYLEQMKAEQDELAQQEVQRLELEEFELYDAAGKQARFEAWRASRRNQR